MYTHSPVPKVAQQEIQLYFFKNVFYMCMYKYKYTHIHIYTSDQKGMS